MAKLYYLQLTRICNQSCRFCSNPSNNKLLELEKAKKIINYYAKNKAQGIILTGGEPTLHENIVKIIEYSKKLNLKVRLITNGSKTSNYSYFKKLVDAGLDLIHISIYSHIEKVQEYLTRTKGSLNNILKSIENARKLGIALNINTVINHYNANHLHITARYLCKKFPFISHFVYNNLDPGMDRVIEFPDTIPKLSEFEASLALTMRYLDSIGKTFRVERVPLCFMAEYFHCSTETRKIVKGEDRRILFLDKKGMIIQNKWEYKKSSKCRICSVKNICAGLYKMNEYYDEKELCPIFVNISEVINKIKKD